MARWYRSIPGIARIAGRPRRRAIPEAAPPDVLAVVCAWCGAAMAFRPIAPAQRGLVSHGLCPDCARRLASASAARK